MKAIVQFVACFVIALGFAACGGGGGGGSNPSTPNTDAAVNEAVKGTLFEFQTSSSISEPDALFGLWESTSEVKTEDDEGNSKSVRVRLDFSEDKMILAYRCRFDDGKFVVAQAEVNIDVRNSGIIVESSDEDIQEDDKGRPCRARLKSSNGRVVRLFIPDDNELVFPGSNPEDFKKIGN